MRNPDSVAMLQQLEPAVAKFAEETLDSLLKKGQSTVNAETTTALFSQAISLKRIADNLAALAEIKPLYVGYVGDLPEGKL